MPPSSSFLAVDFHRCERPCGMEAEARIQSKPWSCTAGVLVVDGFTGFYIGADYIEFAWDFSRNASKSKGIQADSGTSP